MNANVNYRIERNIHRTGILLSVIIPSHNAEKTLRRAVDSVVRAIQVIAENATLSARKAQEADGSGPGTAPLCEILVIENESEDGTAALALELQAEHPECVFVLHSKSGVSYARNRGLEAARGEWILFLDADDYLMEGAGEALRDDLLFTGTDLIVHSYESGDRVVSIPGGALCRQRPHAGLRADDREPDQVHVCLVQALPQGADRVRAPAL